MNRGVVAMYISDYEALMVILLMIFIAFIVITLIGSTNYKLTIIVAAIGLAVFTFVAISQIDRLKAKQWTL